jgi:hypothetical protein
MESVTVYGYICIGLVGCALLGLIAFTYIALRRLRQVPQRWVYFCLLICVHPKGV